MKLKIFALMVVGLLYSAAGAAQTSTASEIKPGLTPGNPLYAVETAAEKIEVQVAGIIGGKELKSKAIANNAKERLAEARKLADRNQSEKASEAIRRYSEGLNQSREMARDEGDRDLEEKINNVSRKNQQTLEEVKKRVPEGAQEVIQKTMNRSSKTPSEAGKNPGRPEKLNKSKEGLKGAPKGKNNTKINEKPPDQVGMNTDKNPQLGDENSAVNINKSRDNSMSSNISKEPENHIENSLDDKYELRRDEDQKRRYSGPEVGSKYSGDVESLSDPRRDSLP